MAYRLALDVNTSAIGLVSYNLDENNQPCELCHIDVHVFHEPVVSEKKQLKTAKRRDIRLHRRQVRRKANRLKKIAAVSQLLGVSSADIRKAQGNNVHQYRSDAVDKKINLAELLAVLLLMAKNRGYYGQFVRKEDGPIKAHIESLETLLENNNCKTIGQLLNKRGCTTEWKQPWKKMTSSGTFATRSMVEKEFNVILDKQSDFHPILKTLITEIPSVQTKDPPIKIISAEETYKTYFLDDERTKTVYKREELEHATMRDMLFHAVFDQRPTWWDNDTIGYCELEPDELRAPKAHPVFQEFRIEQLINDLRWVKLKRGLSPEEKNIVRDILNKQQTISAEVLYKKLNSTDRFTHHRYGDKEFMGNKTKIVFDKLEQKIEQKLSAEERGISIHILADIGSMSYFNQKDWEEHDTLQHYFTNIEQKHNVKKFINTLLEKDLLKNIKDLGLDPGRAQYSIKAMKKLLPHISEGMRVDEARDKKYTDWKQRASSYNLTRVRNIVVLQALKEMKKAIDFAIKKHGGELPYQVVIELSRDMKCSDKVRESIEKSNNAKNKKRREVKEEIKKYHAPQKEENIQRYLFWEEQGGCCAFCGKKIPINALFSDTDLAHIIPHSYGGARTYSNLVTSCKDCNNSMGARLPLEAFSGTRREPVIRQLSETLKAKSGKKKQTKQKTADDNEPARKKFDPYRSEKRKKADLLLIEDRSTLGDDFSLRQNHDTSWIGREITQYLKELCNITLDNDHVQDRVYVSRGVLTSFLRRDLGLETVIPDLRKKEGKPVFSRDGSPMDDGGKKQSGTWHNVIPDTKKQYDKRIDHRHHVVDAAVIGLVDRSMYQKATKHIKKHGKLKQKHSPENTFQIGHHISLIDNLRRMLEERLYKYEIWHKPDKYPIGGFFKEHSYRIEHGTSTLILRKSLEKLLRKYKDFDKINEALNLIVGTELKEHMIATFKERYEISSAEKEIEKISDALGLGNKNTEEAKSTLGLQSNEDGIYFPKGTTNKVRRVRMYHKVTNGPGHFDPERDKKITVKGNGRLHTHHLYNDGYACVEIPAMKFVTYHEYWSKQYQAKIKIDNIVRIYKSDIVFDEKTKKIYVVEKLMQNAEQLHSKCTTETQSYDSLRKKKI